ncbi:MAG: gliding motility-associated C-terminal domain-containing protein [Chitinophagales bacterium]|nr:gliding motility-associated C-terminal domain-containing protein [Chitinophagales bacterium]
MKKILLAACILIVAIVAKSQCVTNVNFNPWIKVGNPGNGNWVVQGGGTSVHQTVNGDPTFFVTPFDMMNVHISGTFRSTDTDDDFMGFVFSFLNPMGATDTFDCWLYDWKQDNQGGASKGMSLNRCLGVLPPSTYTPQFWNHQNNAAFTCVQNNFGSAGWGWMTNHDFDLYLSYSNATIYIDGNLIFDQNDCFKPGRFGFYNLSQRDCYYSNFQYELFIDFEYSPRACLGQSSPFNFVPACVTNFLPQYQSMTWNFGDGSPPVTVNNPTLATVNTQHTYTTPGNYTVTLSVVDYNGCTATASHAVQVAAPITLAPTYNQPPCNGGTNGSITVAPSGGFGNYSYLWNGGPLIGPTLVGVGAGTYVVSVTDGTCNTTAQYTLNQPPPLTATTSHIDAPCAGNGSATIAITGGTPPYNNVTWAGFPGYTVSLPAGTWIANFNDANGCSALLQYTETITQLPCGITSSVTKTNVTCFGVNNGTATLTVTGVTGTANITWSNGQTGATATNLAPGTYTYNFSDANPGHAFSGTVTITGPTAGMVVTLSTIGITCAGANNGQAIASVSSGGTPPYTYAWSGGGPNNPVKTGLAPGPVTVTVTDNNGCIGTATGTVSAIPSLTATLTAVMDSCYHSGKGSVTATVTGGSQPYTYAWNNFTTQAINANVIGGTYTVTVTDNNGCSTTGTATVNTPTVLGYTYTRQDVLCHGQSTGSLNFNVTGGTAPYNFVWTPATVSGSNPTGLDTGIYNATITDAYGCVRFFEDTIYQPAAPLNATTSHTDVTCPGASNGTITITVSGGTDPYTILGNNIPTAGTIVIPNLPANTYAGNLVDSNGCTVALSETITEPAAQSLSLTSTNVTCNGYNDGTATANFVNATGTVQYNWAPGGILPANRTGLSAATYSVTGTDANGCTVTGSTTITEPTAISVQQAIVPVSCFGGNDGSITLTSSGGAGTPFGYTWNPNVSSSNSATSLTANTYSITVTDAANCSVLSTATVTEPLQLSVTSAAQDVQCFGGTDGSITLTVSGGTTNYNYTWSPNVSTSNSASSLNAGQYDYTVTDANNCTVIGSNTLTTPASAVAVAPTQTDLTCYQVPTGTAMVNASGGTGAFSYVWSPNVSTTDNASSLLAGIYNVTASDANNCSITTSFTITEPTQLTLTESHTNNLCFGDANGTIDVTANGGTGTYNYQWTPNVSTGTSASLLSANTYSISVQDANNCVASVSVVITSPAQINLNATATNAICFGESNGTITANAAGGTTPYSYGASPDGVNFQTSLTGQFNNLAAGNYTVVVADANLCSATTNVVISEPTVLAANSLTTDVSCFGYTDGTINTSANGGTPSYTYSISGGSSNNTGTFTSLSPGNYTVLITDANGCTTSNTAIVNEPLQVLLSVTPDSIVTDIGNSIQINTTTNQPGTVTYNWQPPTGLSCYDCASPVFSSNYSTVYTVTITNSNGCSNSAQITAVVVPNYTVFIPNSFTPNADGANDVWQIFGNIPGLKQMNVMVFNRIGEKVFESNDINFGWDGNYKGAPSPNGVYTYVASFVWLNNHSDSNYKGSVTLIR